MILLPRDHLAISSHTVVWPVVGGPQDRRAPLLSRSRGALTSHARTTPPRTHRADGYAPTITCVLRSHQLCRTVEHRLADFVWRHKRASHLIGRVERDRQEFCKVIRTGHSLVIRRRKIAQASIAARNMDDGATIHNVWHQLLRETDGSNVIDSDGFVPRGLIPPINIHAGIVDENLDFTVGSLSYLVGCRLRCGRIHKRSEVDAKRLVRATCRRRERLHRFACSCSCAAHGDHCMATFGQPLRHNETKASIGARDDRGTRHTSSSVSVWASRR